MNRRLANLVVAVLLTFVVGGHWAALQTAAWVGMTISFSKSDPLPMALKKTFGGEHPCQLCKTVSDGMTEEKSPEFRVKTSKLDLMFGRQTLVIFPPLMDDAKHRSILGGGERSEAPPTPPPLVA